MLWVKRTTPLSDIDIAGKTLISRRPSSLDVEEAIEIINEWRAAHAFPLNTMQMRLRNKASEVDRRRPFVSQRIKRLPAIDSKLRRLKNVTLSQMQDIGGCRGVVASNRQVARVAERYKQGRIRHKLERENDYIAKPTPDGYRSLHLIYRYYSDQNPQYDGQRIEVQIRSRLQHAWATAVETVDAFTSQNLKGNLGRKDFARFFSLMGSWIAFRERTTFVPNTPDSIDELLLELKSLSEELNIADRLRAFRASVRYIQGLQTRYHIIQLDQENRRVRATSYDRFEIASSKYAELETQYRNQPHMDVLLASVHGAELRRAYPNYFADTNIFIRELSRALKSNSVPTAK